MIFLEAIQPTGWVLITILVAIMLWGFYEALFPNKKSVIKFKENFGRFFSGKIVERRTFNDDNYFITVDNEFVYTLNSKLNPVVDIVNINTAAYVMISHYWYKGFCTWNFRFFDINKKQIFGIEHTHNRKPAKFNGEIKLISQEQADALWMMVHNRIPHLMRVGTGFTDYEPVILKENQKYAKRGFVVLEKYPNFPAVTRLQNVFATLAWFSIASLMYVSYLFFSDDVEKNAEFVTIEFIVLIVVCVISCPLGIYYTKKGRKLEGDLRK